MVEGTWLRSKSASSWRAVDAESRSGRCCVGFLPIVRGRSDDNGCVIVSRAGLGCSSYGGVAPQVGGDQPVRVFGLVSVRAPKGVEGRKAADVSAGRVVLQKSAGGASVGEARGGANHMGCKPPSRGCGETNPGSRRTASVSMDDDESRGKSGRPLGVFVGGRRSWSGKLQALHGGRWWKRPRPNRREESNGARTAG